MSTDNSTRSKGQSLTLSDREVRNDSPVRRAASRFLRHKLAMLGLLVLFTIVLAAIFAPIVGRYDPTLVDLRAREEPPSAAHWFGTDRTGRDVWSRTVHAGRISLSVGLVSISIATLIGTTLGALSGYYGGQVDNIIMRITDVVMTFPSLIIILTIVAIVGPSIFNVMLVIGLLNWPQAARIARSVVLATREQQYVDAARCLGLRTGRIILVHILPSVIAPMSVYVSFGIAGAILLEAGLSFLGLGVQPPTPSWGNMLNVARSITVMEQQPWLWIPPGIMIAACVLAINFIGDGLRDALDPRATTN